MHNSVFSSMTIGPFMSRCMWHRSQTSQSTCLAVGVKESTEHVTAGSYMWIRKQGRRYGLLLNVRLWYITDIYCSLASVDVNNINPADSVQHWQCLLWFYTIKFELIWPSWSWTELNWTEFLIWLEIPHQFNTLYLSHYLYMWLWNTLSLFRIEKKNHTISRSHYFMKLWQSTNYLGSFIA